MFCLQFTHWYDIGLFHHNSQQWYFYWRLYGVSMCCLQRQYKHSGTETILFMYDLPSGQTIIDIAKYQFFHHQINTLRQRQNGRHFADDLFKCIFLNENVWIWIEISMKFVPRGQINKIPASVPIMAWHQSGDKPLSETMIISLLTDICITWPQCVNITRKKIFFIINDMTHIATCQHPNRDSHGLYLYISYASTEIVNLRGQCHHFLLKQTWG